MSIVLNGTTGITTPDVSVTAQSSDIVTSGNIEAVNATLSGSVYLGGTAAANALDDYEEGTWTPTVVNSGTNPTFTYVNRSGTYTKIGRLVTVVCSLRLNVTNVGSGTCLVIGLPFSADTEYAGAAWGIDNAFVGGAANAGGYIWGTTVYTSNVLRVLNGSYITFTGTYETT